MLSFQPNYTTNPIQSILTDHFYDKFTGTDWGPEPLNSVTGAIVPYNGFNATPQVVGILNSFNGKPLSKDEDMGAFGVLPKECIARIFAELSVSDIYKLDFGYRKAVCSRLAEGIPTQIENISYTEIVPVAKDLANLSRTCKTFYSLTSNLRKVLLDSKHGPWIEDRIKFLEMVNEKKQARLDPNYVAAYSDEQIMQIIIQLEEQPIKNKARLETLYLLENMSKLRSVNLPDAQLYIKKVLGEKKVVEQQLEVENEVTFEKEVEIEQEDDLYS